MEIIYHLIILFIVDSVSNISMTSMILTIILKIFCVISTDIHNGKYAHQIVYP